VTASAIVAAIAIAGTIVSQGPFTQATTHESLFGLQSFIGITAATFLILGASVSERERSREQLTIAHNVVATANRAKAEFLAVMSHELRTPLNAIAGYAEILSLGVGGDLTDNQRDAIERIQKNQQHLLSLIDDVLSFAKVEAGKSEVAPRPVSLREALDSLEPLVRPDLARRRLAFTWAGCDSTLTVYADPVKLRQLLLNVLGNAIKFTPHNGRIDVSAARSGDRAIIRVADTGIGIPADKIDRIFEPFFQVQSGTTREYAGVGLGLAIARDFARAMGGDIAVESIDRKGTVVTIHLPLLESARA
jgi:signal transduction histidine kinase